MERAGIGPVVGWMLGEKNSKVRGRYYRICSANKPPGILRTRVKRKSRNARARRSVRPRYIPRIYTSRTKPTQPWGLIRIMGQDRGIIIIT